MWDYDKLFTKGNVVGLKDTKENKLYIHTIYEKEDWMDYFNDSLSYNDSFSYKVKNITPVIQYIIRLDENGNVIEKLFDREEDMPKPMPKLETGMFVRVNGYDGSRIGFVDAENNHVIYQEGGYDFIDNNDIISCGIASKIVEIYGKDTLGYDFCTKRNLIWYKSKSN